MAATTASKKLPKGITMLPSGSYRVNIVVKGVRFNKAYPTLEEAKGACDLMRSCGIEQRTQPAQGQKDDSSSGGWTLQEAVDRTFQTAWNGMASERTNMFNSQAAIKFFGANFPVSKITLDRIDEYMAHCQSIGNSNSTVNKKLMCLSRVMRTAHERGKLKVMPKIRLKKEEQNRIRFLSAREEERLLATMAHFGYLDQRDAVECLLYTGFRCSELWRLEKRDIDFKLGTITLWRTKSGQPRTISIADKIRPILETRGERCANDTDKIFPGANNDWLRWAWERVRAHLGLADDPQFVPHMLRHTCATRLAQGNVPMRTIKEWLGHSSITTTARYTHFAPTDLTNAAKVLG